MSKETGGPAFPGPKAMWAELYQGMTLRDYFAAKAMEASLVATMNATKGDVEKLAKNSYAVADWMLAVRKEE